MNQQHRAAMQQALDALINNAGDMRIEGAANILRRALAAPAPENIRTGPPYDSPAFESLCRERGIWGAAEAALCAVFWRAAATEPARTLADPVTDDEIDAAFSASELIDSSVTVDEMRRALEGFAAGRAALAAEMAEAKTKYALLYARVREQDLIIAQLRAAVAPDAPADKTEQSMTIRDLVALVWRMASSLRRANPQSPLPQQAIDYVNRAGLTPSPLRGSDCSITGEKP